MSRADGRARGPLTSLAALARAPLYRDGYALLLATGLASVLGIVHWALAARLYPAATVGFNSAVLSAMMLVSGLAQLNMTALLLRYRPVMGRSRRRLVEVTYAGTLLVTLALAGPAVVVLPRIIEPLADLRAHRPNRMRKSTAAGGMMARDERGRPRLGR